VGKSVSVLENFEKTHKELRPETADYEEFRKIKKDLECSRRTLETIVACQEVLVLSQTKSDLLQKICDVIISVGGFRMVWIGIAQNSRTIKPLAYSGIVDEYLEPRKLTLDQKEGFGYPSAKAICEEKPYLVQDIVKAPQAVMWQTEALKRGYSSVLALPLKSNNQTFGSLCMYASEPDYVSEKDTVYFNKLAENMVYGIVALQTRSERYRAEEKLKTSLEKLRKALGAIIEALENTVEVRDPYTAGHQRRVADLGRSIGSLMGLSEDSIDGIRIGGILHDIGKIYVPTDILMMPRRLSTQEFDLVKLHPQVGYNVLKGIDFPWPVPKIVLQHHERLDGSGYPQGLRDKDILIEAKILAVADVVEAMASHRPYRPALGIDKALEEIRSNQGELYSPEVVAACLSLFKSHNYTFEN
jgi:HD-GYP domain-containing protein (c-di-GMP phosphodiesterase class II)